MLDEFLILGLDFTVFLFMRESLIFIGISDDLALHYAIILTLILNAASFHEVKISEKFTKYVLELPNVINVNNEVYYFNIKIKSKGYLTITLNIAGFIVPLVLALVLSLRYFTLLKSLRLDYLMIFILLTLLATLIFNRLGMIFRHYVGISLVKSYIIGVLIGLIYGFELDVYASLSLTYVTLFIAIVLGVDILNMGKVVLEGRPRSVSIGGMGIADAIFVIPLLSSLTSYYVISFISNYLFTQLMIP